ncbi:glycosyltransferase family 4 protein [Methanosarcina flavescens]|jgi:glycosyltransferase involved in cell wall biosynthesis|uniref:Glycosyltransferase family 1 protein n=2 Tax=Methanosarcina TaxID=2207 RepID=A0A660HTG4_9EURY|nr:glycosyltransferase family 4 protein [Methanosarcina flavescens]AYK15552.1 glycosyltransferase family 1 protein [Methanosarcina flavescens]BAW30685.1 phosphatidylinositol glycan-class A [Methanosarcina thermophila]
MRICVITSAKFPPEEGIGNYIYNMSKEFIRKGHQVTVITRGSSKAQEENFEGIRLYRAPFFPLYPLHVQVHGVFVNKLFASIKSDFDVVHYHTPLPPPIKTNLPTVTTVHTPMKTDTGMVELVNPFSLAVKLQGKVSCLIESRLFNISDIITSVASSVSQELGEYGLNPGDVEVIGNGVDENLFCPIQNKTNEKYILYTGRLSYRKGLVDFIECGISVCSRYPDVNFKLTGKGPLFEKLKGIVHESGYQDRFEFLGHVEKSKLIELYQNATIFVLPSHYEGLPTTLLEAMSCGLPVVATAVSGNLDVIESGKNGILVPIKSPDRMAEAVSFLLDNEKLRTELGIAARKTIEQKFTWSAISDKILRCYYSICKEPVAI